MMKLKFCFERLKQCNSVSNQNFGGVICYKMILK